MISWRGHPALVRSLALIRKDGRQMLRDRSTLTLGIILPIVLLLLFGFGLSLDVNLVPVALVRDTSSPVTRDLLTMLERSPYFRPAAVPSLQEAEDLLRRGKVAAIVRRTSRDDADGAESVQIIVNGRDANTARIMLRHLEGAVTQWDAARRTTAESFLARPPNSGFGRAEIRSRVWYNHALESRHFLVLGVTVLIMTLTGAMLTALVVAREWERGTWEALVATPVRRTEIILGKTVPYFLLGMVGLSLCLAAARWIFDLPMRGSLALIVAGSALYLLVSMGMGLLVSAAVKDQFLSGQIVLVASFMPTLLLSDFIFDLKSAPEIVWPLAHAFPATWYVHLLQNLFLVGDVPHLVARDILALAGFAVLFLGLVAVNIRKTLE